MPLLDDDGSWIRPTPPPPSPPPTPPPAPPGGGGTVSPPAPPAEPRNALGETLAQAEAAVLDLVAGGMLGADALALHPLPPGTSTAEALRFLASLPQTTYVIGQPGGTVTGPPLDTLPPAGPPDPSDGDPAGEEGPIPTDDDYAQWEQAAFNDTYGDRTLQAVTHPAPGTIIGRPYGDSGTHSRAFNRAHGTDNWQSENAVDVWLNAGTPIVAPDSGTISPAGWGYGKSHDSGRLAGYRFHLVSHSAPFVYFGTHLRSLVVEKGEKVSQGQLIGYSGIANGVPHLHFAVPPGYDPAAYVKDAYRLGPPTNIRDEPAAPPSKDKPPVDVEKRQGDVEDAYHQLARVLAYTLPDATVNIRRARRSLGDAVR